MREHRSTFLVGGQQILYVVERIFRDGIIGDLVQLAESVTSNLLDRMIHTAGQVVSRENG